ncbi:MAG: ATP-binding cassette domain-containing protein [Chloroflexi bacterium]|jgi:energy-coupling factor transporter ATP-binding protein EcfA2|nr:ATP-binding cassette domain-containing protein [Chloroflexota bacterium]
MAELAARFRGVHYHYPGVPALEGVDFELRAGEFCALVGQNGSGKSTLAKHLNGLLKPVSGFVEVFGRDTRSQAVGELARKVGYVFQNPDHQIFSARVRDELAFGPRNLRLPHDEVERRVDEALDGFGLRAYADMPPATLGFGLRRLVSVAAVFAMRPSLFVLDEPTAELDWRSAHELLDHFRELHQQGHTILLISHDMELVAEYAERVLLMQAGRIVADAPPGAFFGQTARLREAHLSPPQVMRLAQRLGDLGMPPETLTVDAFADAFARLWREAHHAG